MSQKNETTKKKPKNKASAMKMLLVFVMICILCSLLLNLFLYRRIIALKKQIKQLESSKAVIENVIQEVSYEFV